MTNCNCENDNAKIYTQHLEGRILDAEAKLVVYKDLLEECMHMLDENYLATLGDYGREFRANVALLIAEPSAGKVLTERLKKFEKFLGALAETDDAIGRAAAQVLIHD